MITKINFNLTNTVTYDAAIIGGGVAGLSLAIQLAAAGHQVVVLEKECYPFHKVCGEYMSLESWNFLEGLGYPLSEMNLPLIRHLLVSAPNGNAIRHPLEPGGFGISRYTLDAGLAALALRRGITVCEGARVTDIRFADELFRIQTADGRMLEARVAAGCFGKRSNIDVKWQRPFTLHPPRKRQYIAVKYHVRIDFPVNTIALHNFPGGYCGLSAVENGVYCLCYLTTAACLAAAGNNISLLEAQFLFQNPFLKNIFTHAEFLWKAPVVIAQVSFEGKSQIERHLLMTGDAAGMISPLCGNGMSMALHAGKMAAPLVSAFLQGHTGRTELENAYTLLWQQAFRKRIRAGRFLQQLLGKTWLTNNFIGAMKPFPKGVAWLVNQTHGTPF